ncbi:MAG: histidine ammonia-lyase [Gammaproteobacteria bacterium]|nr:histidine ammonia-lyase [Gammaproteobacteria bacterium]
MSNTLTIDGQSLTMDALREWEKNPCPVALSDTARARMAANQAEVEKVINADQASYGINTGFGAFAKQRISADKVIELQYNLVRSHACGVGDALPAEVTRRLMLLKANSLAVGHSGIRPEVVDVLLALLNADVLPIIPERGSVGASGDLAPLAHLALALIGEGEAITSEHNFLEGEAVLEAAGCHSVELAAKEGLALLNGTQLSAALAIEGLFKGRLLLETAIRAGAMSVEGLAGSYAPFDSRVQDVRRMPGQIKVGERFRSLLTGSDIHDSHAGCDRVQDPYALRCMPQVFGGVQDTLDHCERILECELNSVSDNPLVFDGEVISAGNFHAEPLAFLSDFMAIALAELGSMSERRTDLLVRKVNPRLEMFLTATPGLESGYMIAHVTAAALASENKTLAHPASVDSIPTSAGQEDHVSMAPWAGHKLERLCANIANILAIELMAASVAVDQMAPLKTTGPLQKVHAAVREIVEPHAGDRRMDQDIHALAAGLDSIAAA